MHVFTMGYGEDDTHRADRVYKKGPKAGQPHPDAGKPYDTITYESIVAMAKAQETALCGLPKEAGSWMQASSYHDHDARFGNVQLERGKFPAIAADIDQGNPTLEIIKLILRRTLGEARFLVWSTASSTAELKKWRILVPLPLALTALGYQAIQHVWFNHLEECGITCDRGFEQPARIIYLPNKGSFYEWYEHDAPLFNPRAYSRLQDVQNYRAGLGQVPMQTAYDEDQSSALANVCRAFDLRSVMLAGDYKPGPGNDLQSPFSVDKKGWGVVLYPNDTWVSQHTGDRDIIGSPTASGNVRGDVVDVLEKCHGWELGAAVVVGNIIMAGFNPRGLPYAGVPKAAAQWWIVRRSELEQMLAFAARESKNG